MQESKGRFHAFLCDKLGTAVGETAIWRVLCIVTGRGVNGNEAVEKRGIRISAG